MKNSLGDLNNYLFIQLERLNDENLAGDALKQEIERSKAFTATASQIISNASLLLEAKRLVGEGTVKELPKTLEYKEAKGMGES